MTLILSTEILTLVQEHKLSDLHIKPGFAIAIRLDGDIVKTSSKVLTAKDIEEFINHYLSEGQLKSFHETLDCDLAIEIGEFRFRVNVLNSSRGVSLVLRKIDTEIPSVEKLNIPFVAQDMANKLKGIVLVTGPTGSGKSTSLAAIIDLVNQSRKGHILTIEDPIEFIHSSRECVVTQREIGRDAISFSQALRAALREDPDVILVGEMRDQETIQLALSAAETGHLVFGTLHTSGAPNTINRIIDVFPAEQQAQIRMQLSQTLLMAMTQRLFKRADGSGRVAGFEIMVANSAVQNLIRDNKVFQIMNVMQTARGEGMKTMEAAIEELVASGQVSPESV